MRRAIKLAQEAGLQVAGIEIRRDSARVLFGEFAPVDQPTNQSEDPRPMEWPED